MSAFLSGFLPRFAARSLAVTLIAAFTLGSGGSGAQTIPPAIPLSQIPLTVAIPAHPQVLFEIGNSQSVDGDLSGAILTGSGTAATTRNSSSPVNYAIPYGFTPPLLSNSDGLTAPYTTNDANGNTADNSPSRLNEAKAGMTAILNTYLPVADFALMDFSFPSGIAFDGIAPFQTWVYQISPANSGFMSSNAPPQPTVQLALTPGTIDSGQSTILSWSTPWATSCTASGGWSGSQSASGGGLTVNPGGTTTYTLSCANASGTTVQSTTLTVGSSVQTAIALAATPGTISAGASTALNWYASGNPTDCHASSTDPGSAFTGAVAYSGSISVSPAATATYTLTCGGTTQTTTLTVGAGNEEILNPCFGASADPACATINASGLFPGTDVTKVQYVVVGASSDDPSINDVLYDFAGQPGVFLVSGNPTASCSGGNGTANPYPPDCSLGDYNALPATSGNSILVAYNNSVPGSNATETGPTNAGYVPFAPQVLYSARGFGYLQYASTNTGNLVVPGSSGQIVSAGQVPNAASLAKALQAFNLSPVSSPPAGTPAYLPNPATTLAPETSNASTSEIKAVAVQSPIAGLLAGAVSYYQSNPPSSNGCQAKRNVVLLTDGLPTEDLSGNAWPPLGSVAAAGYGVYAAFNADGSLNTSSSATNNDQALIDTISEIATLGSYKDSSNKADPINTYVIGLGAGVQPQNNPAAAQALNAMAIAGGTGGYFAATSAAALTSDLQQILQAIIGTSESISSAAVNSVGLNTGTTLYQASFSTQDTYQDWTGDLEAFAINMATGAPDSTATWSAQTQLDFLERQGGTRLIATWDPALNCAVEFEWNQATGNTLCGSGSSPPISTSSSLGKALTSTAILPVATDASGSDRLSYLRGSSAQEQRNGGTFRNRTHTLGDIVDSNPLYVSAPNSPYQFSSYLSFEQNNQNRQPVIYSGANDGMLHAFNAGTGDEMFAFIPNGVFNDLPMLTSPYYNAQHHFFVDGSPQEGDALFSDGSWHSVLVGGENAGGSTIYALDVTNPAGITSEAALASAVLWEFSDPASAGNADNLGNTYGAPVIAQIASSTSTPAFAVFFGNGYNSPSGQPFLYALNPQTGAVLAKINLCAQVPTACSSATTNGLSGVAVVNSSGALYAPADTVYAGDLQGNLWRINISSSTPSNWTATVLFKATDDSATLPALGNPQPITQPPQVSLNPAFPQLLGNIVLFGTGQLLSVGDLATTQTQTMYGVYDPGLGKTYTRSNLVQQTLTLGTTTTTSGTIDSTLSASGNAVNLNTSNGWYADLSFQSGLRDVTPPVLENGGVLVTTLYAPNVSQCSGQGTGFILLQNFATGGGFNTGQFLLPGNDSIGATPGNVVGLSLGSVYAASVTVVDLVAGTGGSSGGSSGGATTNITPGTGRLKFSPESNRVIFVLGEAGPAQSRKAWWELQ